MECSFFIFPELAESVWYLYRATGNPLLLEIGKNMIMAINKTARVECGFATVRYAHTQTCMEFKFIPSLSGKELFVSYFNRQNGIVFSR